MALEKTRGQNYDLSRLLTGIHEGTVVLPEFQREFVWGNNDIRALLATVLAGWPLGSLLVTPYSPHGIFRVRPFENVVSPVSDPELVVLDGQQRLTSLYNAFMRRGNTVYAVRLDLLDAESRDDLDETIEAIPIKTWEREYSMARAQYEANLVPIYELRDAADFFEWRDSATTDLGERARLTAVYRDYLSGMYQYEVPAIVMNKDLPASAIARVFERVNRQGQVLSTFDLVVAKSFRTTFNLREVWADLLNRYPALDTYLDGEGISALQVISLRNSHDLRQKAILELSAEAVHDGIESAAQGLDVACKFLAEKMGIWHFTTLPYKGILPVLGSLGYGGASIDEVTVAGRIWASWLTGELAVAANTRAVSLYLELIEGARALRGFELDGDELMACSKKSNAALHRTVVGLLGRVGVISRDGRTLRGSMPLVRGEVRDVSVLPRDARTSHLRSLGFIWLASGEAVPNMGSQLTLEESTILTSQHADTDVYDGPEPFLAERLEEIRVQAELATGVEVKVSLNEDSR